MRRPLVVLLILCIGGPAAAAVPDASTMLRKSEEWSRKLPALDVTYELLLTRRTEQRKGSATLTALRQLETEQPELRASRAFAVYGALLKGGGVDVLRQADVDSRITVLYHLHRRVVVIVGAEATQRDQSQIWFDRDTGAPVRIILVGRGGREDLTLGDHDAPKTRGKLPGFFHWRSTGELRIDGKVRRVDQR